MNGWLWDYHVLVSSVASLLLPLKQFQTQKAFGGMALSMTYDLRFWRLYMRINKGIQVIF